MQQAPVQAAAVFKSDESGTVTGGFENYESDPVLEVFESDESGRSTGDCICKRHTGGFEK